ncbi:cytosolic iron-sulfur protein assembly protein 1, putative [Hepatocystis sp. ex Piliocolobus tephrosceles]|nr:cytosolic iron-sulfur protein assembly protein 1, putative [Hepatocystis sp. ex Piliocolobus tephrosceles]
MTIELAINLENHKRRIWSICWSPDGNLLASVGADRYITLWHKKNIRRLKETNDKNKKCKIEFDIYDIIETNHEKSLRHIEFSKDGNFFIVSSFDSKCSIYKKDNYNKWIFFKTLEGHEKEVKCASIHPTNKYIVTCGRDKSIWIHAKTEKVKNTKKNTTNKNDTSIYDSINYAYNTNNYNIKHGNSKKNNHYNDDNKKNSSNEIINTNMHNNVKYYSLVNNNSNKKFAYLNNDNNIDFIFDAYLTAHTEDIKFVSWCPLSENTFVSLSYDNSLKIWNKQIDEWTCIQTLNEHKSVVWCVAFNFDGSQFATCSDDRSIRVWSSNKKQWYNKHKYSFLYEQIVRNNAALSFNNTSKHVEIKDMNNKVTEKEHTSNHSLSNNNIGNSTVDIDQQNIQNGQTHLNNQINNKNNDTHDLITYIDIQNELNKEQDVHNILNKFIKNKFTPFYVQYGVFKHLYNYSHIPNKTNEHNKSNEYNVTDATAGTLADEVTGTITGSVVETATRTENDITHVESKNNLNSTGSQTQNNSDKITNTVTDLEKNNNKQNKSFHSDDSNLLLTVQDINEKKYDVKNIIFDDWEIKYVIEGYHKRSISYLDWNLYEDLIAASSFDNSLKIFQKKNDSWQLAENIEDAHLSDVNCVVWCPQKHQDCFLLATAGDDCVINIWMYTKNE